ncbi:guanylate cyclase 32E-like isoform X2 [Lineus longissimus]|uniref:guanylate cyclase 32E-like isoform X2 n=1 Tax=Lineus longissimus TaxID=88925 RepID=UPI00315D0E74
MRELNSQMRISFLCFWLFLILIQLNMVCLNARNFTISFLPAMYNGAGKKYVGAFDYAIDQANNGQMVSEGETLLKGLGEDYMLQYAWNDTQVNTMLALNAMCMHHYKNGAIAFIGPEDTCNYEAKLAGALNLPMVGFKCSDHSLSDKTLFPTFARTLVPTSKVWKSIIATIKYFKWKKFTPISYDDRKWKMTADKLIELSRKEKLEPNTLEIFTRPYMYYSAKEFVLLNTTYSRKKPNDKHNPNIKSSSKEIRDIIMKTKDETRIYVFLGDKHEMLDFMRMLSKIVDPKDYVVITVDMGDSLRKGHFYKDGVEGLDNKLSPEKNTTSEGVEEEEKKRKDFEILTKTTKIAFRMSLVISPRDPGTTNTRYAHFMTGSKDRSKSVFGVPVIPGLSVPFDETYAVALYDAVYIYVRALHAVLRNKNESVTDGRAIVKRIFNTTFESIKGHSVFIDQNGDAEGNFTLLAMKEDANGTLALNPVGSFRNRRSQSSETADSLELKLNDTITWLAGAVPPDEPPCGFDNKGCDKEFNWTVATICIISACVILIATVFACRHYLYEQKLASLTWKVDFKEIVIPDYNDEPQTIQSKAKNKVCNQYSFLSWGPSEVSEAKPSRHVYTKMGSHKGIIVSIKHLKKKHVEMNRTIKKELQSMLKINHDNINRFIGACVDPGNICIISVYCQRGSVYDILRNENNIDLDEMFIKSLVADLIKGMIYIHESEIVEHGNLRSTNCLVDSRWVLQISGFGLHHFKSVDSFECFNEDEYYSKQLWRAPELLHQPKLFWRGTQKGDVFSFAIILHELVTKGFPWGYSELSPKEIISRVKNPAEENYFRPNTAKLITHDFILKCMEDCWSEDPDSRPDFKYIRIKLKPMQQGLRSNIFDNMVSLMEKYAHNLEELVDEKTQLLSEEKKKTEALLHKLLPKSVAEQLKKNCPVVPEQYECVTIYFSDIVGFTALSAKSSPMEVVDLLNDLYTLFDSIIGHYDVYKVETIGDAYMVVSGLPIRNGDNHAGEVASMSLHLLKAIKSFKARHRPEETIQLRIGIHSGKCVAGVVGLKMPRYCLFGDTVNTASRMESTGLALKIHCSGEAKAILDKLGGYHIAERGLVNMKGIGDRTTYFLVGEDETHRLRRISKDHTMISKIDMPICLSNSNSTGSILAPCALELDDDLSESPTSALLVNGGIPNEGVHKASSNEFLV